MAKKTVFQNIDDADVINLGIEDGVYYGVCATSSLDEIATVLSTEDIDIYQEIEELLVNETTSDLTTVKKGFVLPGCSVSADRIKEAAKEHGITITNDYESADFIITDGYISADVRGEKYPTSKLLVEWTNGYLINDHKHSVIDYHTRTGFNVLWDQRCVQYWNLSDFEYESAPYTLYLITGLAINIATKIKGGEMHVVDTETLLNSSANIQTLSQELLNNIEGMLRSGDDREMLGALLPTIDYRKTPTLMWKLACLLRGKDYYWNRNKDVKYWWDVANISELGFMNAEEAVIHFDKIGKLDSENFKMLEPICREEISISNRSLYVFKVQVSPKWRKYLTKKKKENE
tara:strand:+ start:381 stop:1421 length:1041 start_codon:yes stop_codon:yes gene_type:complete